MDKDSAITGVDIERMYSRGTVDLRGAATRRQDGGYRVALTGPFFDASPWMDGILDMSSGGRARARPSAGRAMPVRCSTCRSTPTG